MVPAESKTTKASLAISKAEQSIKRAKRPRTPEEFETALIKVGGSIELFAKKAVELLSMTDQVIEVLTEPCTDENGNTIYETYEEGGVKKQRPLMAPVMKELGSGKTVPVQVIRNKPNVKAVTAALQMYERVIIAQPDKVEHKGSGLTIDAIQELQKLKDANPGFLEAIKDVDFVDLDA